MREIWEDLNKWRRAGTSAALATVITTSGATLRTPGAKMAISTDGQISGSVTGGCVEGAVFEEAQAVMETGVPRLLTYGGPDAAEWEVGLVCGGSIQVFVESLNDEAWESIYPFIDAALTGQQPVVSAVTVDGVNAGRRLVLSAEGQKHGDLGFDALNGYVARYFLEGGVRSDPVLVSIPSPEGMTGVFIEFITPRPRLVIVGAVHLAIPLAALAKTANFQTIIVDARSAFATPERFPDVDQLIVEWPGDALTQLKLDSSACVVCLSHDPKLDNPALIAALNSLASYIGALGSRRAHAKRLEALRAEGVNELDLERIHAPVGLNLGARQPEEIAVAILAEIIAVRNGHAYQPHPVTDLKSIPL